jgi:ketopantoate reductase
MAADAGELLPIGGKVVGARELARPLYLQGMTVLLYIVASGAQAVAFRSQQVAVGGGVGVVTDGAPLAQGRVHHLAARGGVVVALQAYALGALPPQQATAVSRVGVMADQTALVQRRMGLPFALGGIVVAVQAELRRSFRQKLGVFAAVHSLLVALGAVPRRLVQDAHPILAEIVAAPA